MLEEEIIEEFRHRDLNCKTNNYIFTGISDFQILNRIPDKCSISMPEYKLDIDFVPNIYFDLEELDIDFASNIKINLEEIAVKDILSYVLELLKKSELVSIDHTWNFNTKFDLFNFIDVLYAYRRIVQLVFYNVDKLTPEDQMLLNEIYYFNTIYFNANAFICDNHFQTYFLSGGRILDNRENYTKVKLQSKIK